MAIQGHTQAMELATGDQLDHKKYSIGTKWLRTTLLVQSTIYQQQEKFKSEDMKRWSS
jgi:hypothetical protein